MMINMTHWVVSDGAPLRTEPGAGAKLASLPKYALVVVRDIKTVMYNELPTTFVRVDYGKLNGWMYSGYVEHYHGSSAPVLTKNPTANPNDAEQYLIWRGAVQYNLCGFFCIAHCIGFEADVEDMLDLLNAAKPQYIDLLFSPRNRGLTSVDDLVNILTMLGREAPFKLANMLKDRVSGTVMMTPGRMANILSSYRVIIGVFINPRSGRLARRGTRHWIVLEDINTMDFGGIVEVYNPFQNRYECYEWDQLVESAGTPSGIMVPK